MGKAGGFFKRLKKKERRTASKKSRGSSGASKADRIAKHNQSVDLYAAKRLVDQLDDVSDSSSDAASTDSEAVLQNSSLGHLRASLGIAPHDLVSNENISDLDDGEEADETSEDSYEQVAGFEDEDEQSDASDAVDDESAEVFPEAQSLGEKGGCDSGSEHESISEDTFTESGSDESAGDAELLLQSYSFRATDKSALDTKIVSASDPLWTKYHADILGAPDATPFAASTARGVVSVQYTSKASKALRVVVKKKLTGDRPLFVHDALWTKWVCYRTAQNRHVMSSDDLAYFQHLQSYTDFMDATRTFDNAQSKMELILLHLLNHWYKAASICASNDKIALLSDDEDLQLRDRGFGKTRLLLCLPMRNIAKRYIETMCDIIGANRDECRKFKQFQSDFSEVEEALDPSFKRRPKPYRQQFEGNIDDSFCFGVHIQSSKLQVYAHVLNSDLIVCSPLGLRKRAERSGDCTVALSSVEVLVVDEAHVLLMQNWDHLVALLRLVNKRPSDTTRGLNDLNRVYPWAIEGKCSRHRQSVFVSEVSNPTIQATFREGKNNSGKVLWQWSVHPGVLGRIMLPIRQHFVRFSAQSPSTVDEERFTFFSEEIMKHKLYPLVERGVRTILFVPSYFDFTRVRNYLYREYRDSFTAVSEYSSNKELRRALGQFTDAERPLLVMTERFYFFKRYFVKMAEVLCFYGPPVFADFYSHLVGKLTVTPNACVLSTFCRFDTHELVRICGTERTKQLLLRESDTFSFVTQ